MPEPQLEERIATFLAGLNKLCEETGLMIAGDPTLFLPEPEDKLFAYALAPDGRLVRQ